MNIRWFSNYPYSIIIIISPKKTRKKAIVEPVSKVFSPALDFISAAKPKSTKTPNIVWSNKDIQSILTQLKETKTRRDTSKNRFKLHV
jgi:hypothetical protein